jgi:hypothetical protein
MFPVNGMGFDLLLPDVFVFSREADGQGCWLCMYKVFNVLCG